MVTIGVDPHKETHSAVAADPLGREISERTEQAVHDGFGQLMTWARELDQEHVWCWRTADMCPVGLNGF